ncbi:hypothetical protein FHX42_001120 [Saccharopolyspora lacisalsi]|uniref:7-cyano-7-deazaguanine synthase n=1 Tax=Halosaccharopolyspora lacisalsi TaxID=1000566 RepID=A0A839DX54_9PSEU|nr:7-cyano-7-deazaguanine synthase [Halosaccharopolyspora lacisalsi]MBA8823791.1 hypothetical protein [Halosaccharopolyspora lacisalsi]
MSELLLYSAGLDSFCAWHYLGHPPALYCDLRHRSRDHELAAIRTLAERHSIPLTISNELDLARWEAEDGIIPLRNVYFAMLASHRARTIWCAGVKGDHTADKSPHAFFEVSRMLTEFTEQPVRLDSPFWAMTKTDIVRWYLDQGLPVEDLLTTFSCLQPRSAGQHCGRCPSCLRRWIALANNGVEAPFAATPWEWPRVHDYYVPAMRDGIYPEHRSREFFTALATVGIHP